MNSAAGSGEENLRSALNKAELEALESLKLQYFQNATRYLAKGDYDNALTEIKRVLLIDPEHRLAREYEVRVTELQASRAQTQKAEPAPPAKEVAHEKEVPRPAPAPVVATGRAPSSRRASGKTWLYVGLIALLLVGTAGVLTLEKVNEEEAPVGTAVAVNQPVSAPVEQPATTAAVEEPTPTVHVPPATEPKQAPAVDAKSASRPEPTRKEPSLASSEPTSTPPAHQSKTADGQRSTVTGAPLLAAVTEKKVEPPASAPAKKEVPLPQPEVKLASIQAPPPEPAAPSTPFVSTEKEPKLLRLEKVQLPSMALKTNSSGEVRAKVLVDKEGKAQQVQIVSSTNSLLDEAVVEALQKSEYSPGMMGNDAVSAWLLIPFKFK